MLNRSAQGCREEVTGLHIEDYKASTMATPSARQVSSTRLTLPGCALHSNVAGWVTREDGQVVATPGERSLGASMGATFPRAVRRLGGSEW